MTKEIAVNSLFALMPELFFGQIKNYVDGTTGNSPMMTKWGSHNDPAELFCCSQRLLVDD